MALRSPVLPRDRVATAGARRGAAAAPTSSWRSPRCNRRMLLLLVSCWRRPRRRYNALRRPFRVNDEILASWRSDSREKRTVERIIMSSRHRLLSPACSHPSAILTARRSMHALVACDVILRRHRWWRHIRPVTSWWRQLQDMFGSYKKLQHEIQQD